MVYKNKNVTEKTAANMGFSSMLADEYILIVPLATQLQSGLNE